MYGVVGFGAGVGAGVGFVVGSGVGFAVVVVGRYNVGSFVGNF